MFALEKEAEAVAAIRKMNDVLARFPRQVEGGFDERLGLCTQWSTMMTSASNPETFRAYTRLACIEELVLHCSENERISVCDGMIQICRASGWRHPETEDLIRDVADGLGVRLEVDTLFREAETSIC